MIELVSERMSRHVMSCCHVFMSCLLDSLSHSAKLFEVSLPEYKQLNQCQKEIRLLKGVWDYHYIVDTFMRDWERTPWAEIDVESMDMDLKKFAKDVKGMDKVCVCPLLLSLWLLLLWLLLL